jgi:gamma-glutamylcyclotransferase (GGCT)/AIG2-like uncharacterized protein YtfP
MEYLFVYENNFDNYLKSNFEYYGKGFMYGSLYNIDGHSAAVPRNYHEKVSGDVYFLEKIDFDYLDNFEGENYIRELILIYTENSIIPCWVYLLKPI